MIDLLKENIFILTTIGVFVSCLVFYLNRSKDHREHNKALYSEKLISKYDELFNYHGSEQGFPEYFKMIDKPYNLEEIISFSRRVTDFYIDGRRFKGICLSIIFCRLHNVAKKLYENAHDPNFAFHTTYETSESSAKYLNFYNKNKKEIEHMRMLMKKLNRQLDN